MLIAGLCESGPILLLGKACNDDGDVIVGLPRADGEICAYQELRLVEEETCRRALLIDC